MPPRLTLIRHGQTEWARSGRHTSHSDIPLDAQGETEARRLSAFLKDTPVDYVFVSPMSRAKSTAELAGLGARATVDPRLGEWGYGDYEGLLSSEIQKLRPGWNIFRDGCPHGESPEQVSARADDLISHLATLQGNIALFSHGHFLRVLGARWVKWPVTAGQGLLLSTASVSILDYEHHSVSEPAIQLWNFVPT